MAELFDHIDELRRSARKVAVATLVNTRGTTPRKEGAKMLVGEGGAVLGSVTIGGCVDAQVIEQSEDVLGTMRPRLIEMNLGDEEAWEIGLTCGGTIEVFVEPVAFDRPDDAALALDERVRGHADAGRAGAIVTRLDGRPGAKLLVLDDGTVEGSLGDAFLDERLVREALGSDVGYIGMLGSPRRGAALLKFLAEEGVSDAALKRIRVPIGLDLGARGAPEIALAILAEIQAVRGGGTGHPLSVKVK